MFQKKEGAKGPAGYRPIYNRWWFWTIVTLLVVASGAFYWYQQQRVSGSTTPEALDRMLKRAYIDALDRRSAHLENLYRNDTTGGETPEETLRLFVEALEDKDFELAAEYFIPENQDSFSDRVQRAMESGGMNGFINAYRNGRVVPPDGVGSTGIYEFELYEPGEDVPFLARLKKNEFTGVWKIIEL